jgi:hypothetical protein
MCPNFKIYLLLFLVGRNHCKGYQWSEAPYLPHYWISYQNNRYEFASSAWHDWKLSRRRRTANRSNCPSVDW